MKSIREKIKKTFDAILRRKVAAALVTLALGVVANHLTGHGFAVSNKVEEALVTIVEAVLNALAAGVL